MNHLKINGWHRLWLVSSLLVLIFLLIANKEEYPTEEQWLDEMRLAQQSSNLSYQERINEIEAHCRQLELELSFKCYIFNSETLKSLHEQKQTEYMRLMKWHNEKIDADLSNAQTQYAFRIITLWALMTIGIYIAGIMIAWIYKGFKNN
jgi:hypothetical protein